MGNRAVVSVEGSKVGVYLHWNGGKESVTAFLRAAKDLGVRAPTADVSYFYARFTQIIANFIGGTNSVGIDAVSNLDTDNGDNGHFIVNEKFEIARTEHECSHGPFNKNYELEVYAACMQANAAIFARS